MVFDLTFGRQFRNIFGLVAGFRTQAMVNSQGNNPPALRTQKSVKLKKQRQ